MANKIYAVRIGRKPGLYNTWAECEAQVKGFPNARYKSFTEEADAEAFMNSADTSVNNQTNATETTNTNIKLPDVYAFVDGSYNVNTGVYGFGGFLSVNGKKYPLQGSGNNHGEYPETAEMRNVAGEIYGAITAVKKAQELNLFELTILYDYIGIEKWAVGEWRTNKRATECYANFMQKAMKTMKIHFQKVAAHSGVDGNELADAMAKNAVGIVLTKAQNELLNKMGDLF